MQYTTRNEYKRKFPFGLILFLLALGFIAMAGISINKIRNGHDGFLTNLWEPEISIEPDPYLNGNPVFLDVPSGVTSVLLLGADIDDYGSFRTDVMLLLVMNTKTSQFSLFSFPRDLWVNIPSVGEQRLNTAYPFGGFQLLSDTLAWNFGFRPDHYAMIDFDGFKEIIEELDGVDVEITKYTEDECFSNDVRWCVWEPGTWTMNAHEALWYIRARKNSSDFERTRKAQEVVKAMVEKALRPTSLPNLGNVFAALRRNVETDMGITDSLLYFVPISKYFGGPDISNYRITENDAVPGMTSGGASVLFPNIPAIQTVLKQALWIE